MIFVDTGGWFALTVAWDINHAAATGWFRRNVSELLTTDYVIDETLTLLRTRREPARALALGDRLCSGRLVQIHYLSVDEIRQSWDTFRRFSDKGWSFTDCTSRVAMERLGIVTAFAFDNDFRQFGTVAVVP